MFDKKTQWVFLGVVVLFLVWVFCFLMVVVVVALTRSTKLRIDKNLKAAGK